MSANATLVVSRNKISFDVNRAWQPFNVIRRPGYGTIFVILYPNAVIFPDGILTRNTVGQAMLIDGGEDRLLFSDDGMALLIDRTDPFTKAGVISFIGITAEFAGGGDAFFATDDSVSLAAIAIARFSDGGVIGLSDTGISTSTITGVANRVY